MVESACFYTRLADREGFNASVRHINRTLDLLDVCSPKNNLADEINRLLSAKNLEAEEIPSLVHMLLLEKFKYRAVSRNLTSVSATPAAIADETSKWKAVDLVLAYHHPDLGFLVLNPKNPQNAALIESFRKYELIVLYAGTQKQTPEALKLAESAINGLIDLVEGRSFKTPTALLSGSYFFVAPKKEKPAVVPKGRKPKAGQKAGARSGPKFVSPAVVPSARSDQSVPQKSSVTVAEANPPVPGQSKMTPLISVVVSNELFHNGNVEAWKRIIRSYNAKYPNLQVFIYYDGERIVDINTLFKWGKVKHGSCIQFRVSGDDIQDLAKLSRYFRQGASPQFEAFLHGSPDTVMNLF
ncbi:MAG: hypothetical protein EWM51_02955 [Treponema sp.]|nr:MAG: hypothetical protein EWM51_02955 [Treponema sp.]